MYNGLFNAIYGLTYSKLWQCHKILICTPTYNIVTLCSALEPAKKFFLSDYFGLDLVTESFFSNLLFEVQLHLATSVLP
jgi:hypothetical protein